MKKNILSLIAVAAFGLTVQAQTFEVYDDASSTTDIAGTTLNVTFEGDEYEASFYLKNISGSPINTFVRRVNILTTTEAVQYGICYGVYDVNDPNNAGLCYPPNELQTDITPNGLSADAANLIAIKTNVLYDLNQPVHFRYYFEDENGVKYDSLDIKLSTTLAVKDLKSAVSFTAYPNPANDVINLSVQGSSDNAFKLIDVLGNVIVEDQFGVSKKLNVSQFKNGVYILTIYSNGKMIQTKRIVVRH